MGDPLNARLTGVVMSDVDTVGLPWWATGILNWIGMVQAMQQATGELSSFADEVEHCMTNGDGYQYVNVKTGKSTFLYGPAAVYPLYQTFTLRIKAEANK